MYSTSLHWYYENESRKYSEKYENLHFTIYINMWFIIVYENYLLPFSVGSFIHSADRQVARRSSDGKWQNDACQIKQWLCI